MSYHAIVIMRNGTTGVRGAVSPSSLCGRGARGLRERVLRVGDCRDGQDGAVYSLSPAIADRQCCRAIVGLRKRVLRMGDCGDARCRRSLNVRRSDGLAQSEAVVRLRRAPKRAARAAANC